MIFCKDRETYKRGVCALAAMALFSFGGVAASKAADPSPEDQKKTLSAIPAYAQKYYGGLCGERRGGPVRGLEAASATLADLPQRLLPRQFMARQSRRG